MKSKRLAALILVLITIVTASAQTADSIPSRVHVTPVAPTTNVTLTPPKGTDEKVIERYLSGDTASARAQERKDSLRRVYPHYPLLTELAIGVNVADAFMALFGQKYGGIDVSATLNMWNRFQPVLELGLGMAKDTPEDMNFTYKGKLSPYMRVGANYNFMFKHTPRYQLLVGARLGFSTFRYDITNVTVTSSYWREQQTFELTGNSSHALWGEFLAGIKVELGARIALGWQVKYQGIFTEKKNAQAQPWYIPGYGTRDGHWAFAFHIYYTLPLNESLWPKKEEPTQKKQR